MRIRLTTLAALAVATATPASAQLSGNPNTLNNTNDRLSNQSEIRGIREQQQFENNQTRMQIQRNQDFQAPPAAAPIVVPRR